MAASPRRRQLSPRKRLPPTPFNQTWHETDTAHLDPNALPVARIPRGWERKREVKQVSDGKSKSIWRRFSVRSSVANEQEEEQTDEETHDAHSRAVKRRQRMSPKAMEKMHGTKRVFKGTRWESGKSTLPRKRSAHADKALHEDQSESDDTPDATDADADADMSHEGVDVGVPHQPSSFTFAIDTAQTVDELPDYESLDEQDDEREDEQKLGNILPEDSTFALIFRSPVKRSSKVQSASPAKVAYPELPHNVDEETRSDTSTEQVEGEDITVTGPNLDSAFAEVIANVPAATPYVVENTVNESQGEDHIAKNPTLEPGTAATDSPELSTAPMTDAQLEDAKHIAYPRMPTQASPENKTDNAQIAMDASEDEEEDADMSEVDLGAFRSSIRPRESDSGDLKDDGSEEVTEASLQMDIQGEYELEGELASQPPTPKPAASGTHNIADGLTISITPARIPSREHTPKKLHSPPPPLRIDSGPDDATMTLAIDDDAAILKSFLSRAAASKAERSAIITRRSSLENRRDSDVVRHALASPRKALEEMDPNSPTKIDSESAFHLIESLVQQVEVEESMSPSLEQPEGEEIAEKAERASRRSSRAKKSRLPAPATAAPGSTTNKIAIRRADGSDPVVLKKTDAQELAFITRNNTRKNKQGAFMVSLRLLKIQADAILSPPAELDAEKPPVPGRRGIRWDETLAYYQEHADTIASQQAEAESLATPDELSLAGPVATKKPKAKTNTDNKLAPKVRRVKGLGTANGTPGKGLLASCSLLPDAVQEEKAAVSQPIPAPAAKGIPKPKVTKKLPVPSPPTEPKPPAPETASVGLEPVKERKSRIAPPKSVKLPKPVSASSTSAAPVPAAEKENKRTGISGATPRKGIPAPRIMAPKMASSAPAATVGVESALPRRRGRKV
ncbi:uncharacterized protein M421DRAFT_418959 [Didymella exigua CBS 183.55]|uniref:Uncharacterized protein n=1 Tax=Didymella exigua CBS 183.55 TaxID=1150837 RepID=A0A6A5RR33_9PLEO|nr:uncharacterized protein M421DRAFT_418959 [Didymella exigua CBS 183.55]KAF1929913.1 hypothetical protein M421DRAFT_418959 [Didymella exigua CBS 183.55]